MYNDIGGQGIDQQLNNAQSMMQQNRQPLQLNSVPNVQGIMPNIAMQGHAIPQQSVQAMPQPVMQPQGLQTAQPAMAKPISPLDMLIHYSTEDEGKDKKEISLKTLKQSEIDKIMKSYTKCRDEADNYYKSTIQPKLIEREQSYYAGEDYYKRKFPVLSETSKFCSRDIMSTVKWMVPSLCEPFLGGEDPIDIKGVNADDDVNAIKIQQLLKYQLQRKNNYPTFIDAIWNKALYLNHAVAKVWWKREEDRERYKLMIEPEKDLQVLAVLNEQVQAGKVEIIDIKPLKDANDFSIITFEKIIVKANYPVVQYMSPSELRYTPDSNTVQGAKFKAHRKIVSGDYLKRKEQDGIYENIDKAMEGSAGKVTYDTFDTNHNKDLQNINDKLSDDDKASKMFELYEAYMQVDYNNDGIYENLIVHAIGDTPISIIKNDMDGLAPFFVASAEPSPDTAFNEDEGFTDNLEQQQDLKTAVFRQIIVNVAKNNSPRTFVDPAVVDMDALINNDEIIPVDLNAGQKSLAAAIMPGQQLQLSNLSMQVIEYAQNEIEAQSGSTRYNQGLDSNSLNKTATGITAIMGSAEKRMKHMARMFSETFLIPLFKYLILLNQKYLDQEQVIRLAEDNIVISKQDLDIDYDLIINVGAGAGTKEAQIQYLMVLINQIYPQLQASGIVDPNSWYQICKDLFEKMGVRNVSNYLIDPSSDKAKQLVANAQQAQQQAKQEELTVLQAKAQLEIAKAKQPHVTVNYQDLPPTAQVQFLQLNGIKIGINDIAQKEIITNAKKAPATVPVQQNRQPTGVYKLPQG